MLLRQPLYSAAAGDVKTRTAPDGCYDPHVSRDRSDYPVLIETPVAWGEMDAFGHVNNAVYFRYFESGRIAYFERVGALEIMEETGVGPILASTHCRFRVPLEYPDSVTIATRAYDLEADRFTMGYAVWSHRHDRLAAEGEGKIVTFDYKAGEKAAVPEALRAQIEALESGRS